MNRRYVRSGYSWKSSGTWYRNCITGTPVDTSLGIADQVIEKNQNTAIDLALSEISAVSPSVANKARKDYEATH